MEKDKTTKDLDELLERALAADQELPEGLSERLERQIDAWEVAEKRQKRLTGRRWMYWISGIAAGALLVFGIFHYNGYVEEQKMSNRELAEAQIAAQDALQLFFHNLNKGVAQVDNAAQNINKVNEVLNKQKITHKK